MYNNIFVLKYWNFRLNNFKKASANYSEICKLFNYLIISQLPYCNYNTCNTLP